MGKNKSKRKMSSVICENCKCDFEKPLSEIKRSDKLGRRHFCSRKCVGTYSSNWFNPSANRYDIKKHSGWKKDEYTKFRYHFRNIRNRTKDVDITMEDMRKVWEEQNGICQFTGVKLRLSSYNNIEKNILYSGSLDRIDSFKGYVKGNIRWVSLGINYLKSDLSDSEVWEVCKHIYINYKKIKKG